MNELNINGNVYVRLTDVGRKLHKKQHDDFNKTVNGALGEYKPPKEDKDGWSKWQLWMLFEHFGSAIDMGKDIPFETTIRLE